MKRALLSLALVVSCQPTTPASLVLRNGRIYTVDSKREWAEAIAISGDTITALGTNQDVARFIGKETDVVDLEGKLVLPGLIDTHIHFLEGSLLLDQVKLDDARSLSEMLATVKTYAGEHPDAPWIQGMGWNYSYVDGGRLPTRQDLDVVVSDRPAFLMAYDGHTLWVNSKALEVAGVTRTAKVDGYGEIVRDKRGEPTGVFKERAAIELVHRAVPKPTQEEKLDALRRGVAEALRFGLTSLHVAHGSPTYDPASQHAPDELDLYEELERKGELPLRVYMAMTISKETTAAKLDEVAALKGRLRGPWIKAGAVKIVMDGVIESHTAGMLAPYSDDPETSGSPAYSQNEIDALVAEADRRGLQIFTHAIGDRSVRMVLDAYGKLAGEGPGARHRIEHIEVTTSDDVPRFAALGVIASMMPYHASPDITGVWARNVGKERAQLAFAWRSLRSAGARVIHGSDWPVVTMDPVVGLHAAVTRQDLAGKPTGGWIPEQTLTLAEAIRGYTIDAAYAGFEETRMGTLEPGKLADLVVLSEDLFKISPARIPEADVLMTVVSGKPRYVSPRFQGRRAPSPSGRGPG